MPLAIFKQFPASGGYPFDKANILRHALFLHPCFHLPVVDSGVAVRVMEPIRRPISWKLVMAKPPRNLSKAGDEFGESARRILAFYPYDIGGILIGTGNKSYSEIEEV